MLSCVAFGETLDGAQGEIMNEVSDVASDEVQTPDEPTQAPEFQRNGAGSEQELFQKRTIETLLYGPAGCKPPALHRKCSG